MGFKYYLMRTINISRQVKQLLERYSEGDSVNNTVKRLIEESEVKKPVSDDFLDGNININVEDSLLNELREFRAYPTEPNSSILFRLLESVDRSDSVKK